MIVLDFSKYVKLEVVVFELELENELDIDSVADLIDILEVCSIYCL